MSEKEIDYKTGKFPFGPPMMCPDCKMKMQSRYRGEFVQCPCGNFVDQTGHYSRYGGASVHWDGIDRTWKDKACDVINKDLKEQEDK